MSRHLAACKERPAIGKGRKRRLFHLVVEGRSAPEYWLHLELPANATLADLDSFLRDIWLECCGHLSAFTVGEERYTHDEWREPEERSMRTKLAAVLPPGVGGLYEYDFGSTTELRIRCVGEREGEPQGSKPAVLARNEPPEVKCRVCGGPAMVVCQECIWDDEGGWYCVAHACNHGCHDEMILPVVNSPRVGECAYTGDEPWDYQSLASASAEE